MPPDRRMLRDIKSVNRAMKLAQLDQGMLSVPRFCGSPAHERCWENTAHSLGAR